MAVVTPEREVEEANARLYSAFETGDVDLMESVWDADSSDAVVCVHPGWPMLRGRAAVLRSWSAVMAGTDYIQFFLTDVRVTVSGDTAAVTCTENVLSADRAVATDAFRGGRGQALSVFKRSSTGWRLWIHHSSPVGSEPL